MKAVHEGRGPPEPNHDGTDRFGGRRARVGRPSWLPCFRLFFLPDQSPVFADIGGVLISPWRIRSASLAEQRLSSLASRSRIKDTVFDPVQVPKRTRFAGSGNSDSKAGKNPRTPRPTVRIPFSQRDTRPACAGERGEVESAWGIRACRIAVRVVNECRPEVSRRAVKRKVRPNTATKTGRLW